MELEETPLFDGRVKCIYCEVNNFSKGKDFSESVYFCHQFSELDRLSIASGQDFLSVICHRCTVSLFLGTLGAMFHENLIKRSINENTGHDIMSKMFFELLGKYNLRCRTLFRAQAEGFSIEDL